MNWSYFLSKFFILVSKANPAWRITKAAFCKQCDKIRAPPGVGAGVGWGRWNSGDVLTNELVFSQLSNRTKSERALRKPTMTPFMCSHQYCRFYILKNATICKT